MLEPFIFISTSRIKEGKLEDFRRRFREVVDLVEEKEPQLIAFNGYLDVDGSEVAIVQVHSDADSMQFHMQVAGEHIAAATDVLETERIDIFGTPSEAVLEMIHGFVDAPVSVKSAHVAGFIRSAAEPTRARS